MQINEVNYASHRLNFYFKGLSRRHCEHNIGEVDTKKHSSNNRKQRSNLLLQKDHVAKARADCFVPRNDECKIAY